VLTTMNNAEIQKSRRWISPLVHIVPSMSAQATSISSRGTKSRSALIPGFEMAGGVVADDNI
jgi:hypothetical protein